jgi:hypothetical protein
MGRRGANRGAWNLEKRSPTGCWDGRAGAGLPTPHGTLPVCGRRPGHVERDPLSVVIAPRSTETSSPLREAIGEQIPVWVQCMSREAPLPTWFTPG